LPDQGGLLGIIRIAGDRPVLYSLDGFVDYEEPLARNDRMAEPVLDLDLQARGIEDAMDEVLEFGPLNVGQLVGGDNLDKEGREWSTSAPTLLRNRAAQLEK
jgi:hypothetical protein